MVRVRLCASASVDTHQSISSGVCSTTLPDEKPIAAIAHRASKFRNNQQFWIASPFSSGVISNIATTGPPVALYS